ncbi:MAG: RnfABCDGE type electron transport complex subunit D [Lachnospiraceae bacterium]|nr:RnfABCDGE type electron transport complex subunit D [Lachnospiraceae bacterium]MBR0154311.1 RnfABCDGE type electron transport complex subunit D [Lachnospiraceae bacterium]
MMNKLNISVSPHARDKMSTSAIMACVFFALIPSTIVGVWYGGMHSAFVLLAAVLTAVLSEFVFNLIVKKPQTVFDNSAAVTGLILGLSLPGSVPLYIPILGSLFAIVVVKCFFGGLGKNFINPALAARCFLMISFSKTMTTFTVDGVSTATPLDVMRNGGAIKLTDMLFGSAPGVIGGCALAMLAGGFALWVLNIIDWRIPVSVIVSFTLFLGLFGGQGFNPGYLMAHLLGGGLLMGAFFMATDYVTSPVSPLGHVIYGCLIGVLGGLFRVLGSAADSFSYAIIISNLFVPLIDEFIVPKPYAYRKQSELVRSGHPVKNFFKSIPKPAIVLTVIALLAGVSLSGVYTMTKEAIEAQQMAANAESYRAVLPGAETFEKVEAAGEAIEALDGGVYGTDFGRVTINECVAGKDASGNIVGYVLSVTSMDGFDGNITLSMGLTAEGETTGIAFTELNETAGMGMRADEPAFKDQFSGRTSAKFVLNKSGDGTGADDINSISGASITSGAVVNAVNAGLDFYNNVVKGGN